MQGLLRPAKGRFFRFYPKRCENSFKGFKQGSDMIRFLFEKIALAPGWRMVWKQATDCYSNFVTR